MIVTPEEAGTMRCCGPSECGVYNGSVRWCAGPGCMAWEWSQVFPPRVPRFFGGGFRPPSKEEMKSAFEASRKYGYCGLVRKS